MDPQPPSVPEPSPQNPPPPPPVMNTHQWMMALYLSPLLGLVVFVAGGFVGPLIVWLLKRAEIPEIEQPGRDVAELSDQLRDLQLRCRPHVQLLEFRCFSSRISCGFVFTIIGAVKASKGEHCKFPLTIKML